MGGSKQKKSSGSSSSFSFFSLFKGHNKSQRADEYVRDDFMKAYKVWPSDEDRGRWVAEPGIDRKATAYIAARTEKWKSVEVAN